MCMSGAGVRFNSNTHATDAVQSIWEVCLPLHHKPQKRRLGKSSWSLSLKNDHLKDVKYEYKDAE